ncbi:TonB system transport protein ExbD [Ostreibacterium oceani]|uniref:Biopolymer transport protein ExbD n=1 Tax=Ostreibacterium oceani TaxID=2654998 RepID=A0A6N7EWZ2_9GAMM|nr:TonB system transport protein ExbD [Ostreibacterium oceani]MPV85647.1 TonB system transport protein ExbD [Ostreibacterium oceani]
MKKVDQMNVIPFIDIMLVLLAIVLMTASFVSQGQIEVTLPESSATSTTDPADASKNVLITVAADGQYYLDDAPITLVALDEQVAQLTEAASVTLKIDADTPFQAFVRVTDILNQHAVTRVSVLTETR